MKNLHKIIVALFAVLALTFGTVSAASAKAHKVDIKSFKFSVKELSVKVGDTITFTNKDSGAHTATADDKSWDTGRLKKGQSKTIKVTAGMTLGYFCDIHRSMKAKLKM